MKKILKISTHLNYVQLRGGTYPIQKISDALSFKVPGYQYSNAYIKGFWDGRHRFLKEGKFPLGLLWKFLNFCRKEDISVKINTVYKFGEGKKILRKRDKVGFDTLSVSLRDYQIEGVDTAFRRKRGIINVPTGGGKTLMMVALLNFLGKPALILTSKKESLVEFSEILKYELFADSVGVMGGGVCDPKIFDVGSFQFLYRNRKKIKKYLSTKWVVLIDEAHHASAKSCYTVINACDFAIWKIGFTATPSKNPTSMITEACIGPVIYKRSARPLITKKYLVEPEITMIKIDKIEGTGKEKLHVRLDYHTAYGRGISTNDYRSNIIGNLCRKLIRRKEYPAILTKTVEHVNHISKFLKAKKVKHVILTGSSPVSERLEVLEDMRNERPKVIIFSTIFDEALDVPALKVLILAGSGRSFRQTIQRIGRGMRTHKGKSKVLIFDFYDNTHGYLLKHSKVRKRIYEKEGYSVLIKDSKDV